MISSHYYILSIPMLKGVSTIGCLMGCVSEWVVDWCTHLFLSMWVFAEEGHTEWRCQSAGFCMKRTSMQCTNYHHINDYPARTYNLVQTRLFCRTFHFNSKLMLPKMTVKNVWETRGNLVTIGFSSQLKMNHLRFSRETWAHQINLPFGFTVWL